MKYKKTMNLLKASLLGTFLLGFMNLQAQFEVYPSGQNYSVLDLNVLDDVTTIELHALENLLQSGSILNMYRFNSSKQRDRTVSIRSALNAGTGGSYGSLRLDAYVDSTGFLNANNVGISPTFPYAMISLVKHSSKNPNASQEFSWNIGVFDRFEYDSNLFSINDGFDCIDCLTFAHQVGVGAAYYKFSFGSDGDFQTASDKRLKKNIVDVDESLEKILSLNPKRYDYIWSESISERKKVGFIAQEVQKIFPDLVSSIVQPDSRERTLMLNYQGLIPHIAKAMQEQQKMIKQQKDLIIELSNRIDALELEK